MMTPDALNSLIGAGRIGPLNMVAQSSDDNLGSIVWQQFTFTPQDTGEWVGYTDGDIASPPYNPPMGTSGSPANDVELTALYYDTNTASIKMLLKGDYLKEAPYLSLSIDGIANPYKSSSTYIGNTLIEFSGVTANFNAGQTYTALVSSSE